VIVYSADVVLGEQSSRKNITIVLHPINEPDDDIRNSFSEEFEELLRSNGSYVRVAPSSGFMISEFEGGTSGTVIKKHNNTYCKII
jgi:hypothetical protein